MKCIIVAAIITGNAIRRLKVNCPRRKLMQYLTLYLDNSVRGEYSKLLEENNRSFYINKDFEILKVFLNKKEIDFKEEISKYNYKKIIFDADDCTDNEIYIEYNGQLDGTTGMYPYVKEKTTDDFYILREETSYFPKFIETNTLEQIERYINPLEEDKFSLKINISNSQQFCTNLKKDGDAYIGFNPTITVGKYKNYLLPFEKFYNS